jgi:hypothetical protein
MFDVIHDTMKLLQPMLQHHVHFNIGHKTVRKGRLMLYNMQDYYVKFTIKTNKDLIKTYEVPYPFRVISTDNMVRFSYKVSDFCRDNPNKEQLLREFEPIQNKMYDKYLSIVQVIE